MPAAQRPAAETSRRAEGGGFRLRPDPGAGLGEQRAERVHLQREVQLMPDVAWRRRWWAMQKAQIGFRPR